MMKNRNLITGALLVLLVAGSDLHAQSVFTQLSFPDGIAADPAGNVYVHSDFVSTTAVTRFTADGTPVAQTAGIGGIFGIAGTALDRDPNSGFLFLLKGDQILLIQPETMEVTPFIGLSSLAFQTFQNVFELTTGTLRPVMFGAPNWGDLAVRRLDANRLDLFLSGTAISSGFPFVMRLRVDFQAGTLGATVMAFSAATTGDEILGGVNLPRGLAASQGGIVLTSLPVLPPGAGAFQDVAVAIGAGLPRGPIYTAYSLAELHRPHQSRDDG